ncbi:ArdC-like ssDNA-binding domain-containing protein [Isoptericola croceus]|uniref:ArdC-like ssDNA-binding domain-containing protein n=1 Tax=Isoptericola croceus TaxID=3031406 RepID=UPI0023F7F7D7|nr:ArdC-like ssDNA-binding domain-containing protein [Isoptericola croceus]
MSTFTEDLSHLRAERGDAMRHRTPFEVSHPRAGDGKFATKAVADPDGGLDALAAPAEQTSPFNQRYDTLEEKLAAFHSELDERVSALDGDAEWNAYLDAMAKFPRYSPTNQLLISIQRPDATKVAGYRRWQQMGRQVDKGQKSIQILAPKAVRVTKTDDAGNPVKGDDGKSVKERKIVGFTTASVFDVAQTSGDPLPEIQTELSETPPPGFVEDLHGAIEAEGFTVSYEPLSTPGHHGYTSPGDKRVVIDAGLSDGSKAATLAHELGHIKAGHLERAGEYHTATGGHRGAMEVEAESIAHVLCRSNGMDSTADTAGSYVKGWALTERDAEVVRASSQTVSKVVKTLLTERTWTNAKEVD